jgi:hypothetical protein
MGGGGNVTINGVEGGQGREDTTINWWRNATINLFRPRFDSIQLVIEAMGGGGNITINGVEGGQGREDTTINWWRTRHQGLRWTWKIRMRRKTQQLFRSTSKQGYCQFGRG